MHMAVRAILLRLSILSLLAVGGSSCSEEPTRGSALPTGAQNSTSGVVGPAGSDPVALATAAADDSTPALQGSSDSAAANDTDGADWPEFLGPHQNGVSGREPASSKNGRRQDRLCFGN